MLGPVPQEGRSPPRTGHLFSSRPSALTASSWSAPASTTTSLPRPSAAIAEIRFG